MFHLPPETQMKIYEFDPTYHIIYKKCVEELQNLLFYMIIDMDYYFLRVNRDIPTIFNIMKKQKFLKIQHLLEPLKVYNKDRH